MRDRIALSGPVLMVVAVLASGCTSSAPPAATSNGGLPVPSSSVNVNANGKHACELVREATDRYSGPLDASTDTTRPRIAQDWAQAISSAGRPVVDASLQTALLSLADVVRSWAARAPSKVMLNGYNNDLNVACRPYTAP